MRRWALLLVALASARLPRAARAQPAPPAPYETTVTAERPPTLAEPAAGAPADVEVIDRARLQASGATTLAQALQPLAGVALQDEQGNGVQLDVLLRGMPASPVTGLGQGVTVFVDGVRVNEPTVGEVNFDLVPLADVERIVVVRGPGALSGRGTLAGAVYIVTRRGTQTAVEAEAGVGRFGQRHARVRAGGSWRAVDGYLSAGYLSQDGFRLMSASRVAQLFGKVGVGGRRGDLTLSYQLQGDRIEQAGSLPASVLATDRFGNLTTGDTFRPLLHQVALNGWTQLGGGVALAGTAFLRALDASQYNANLSGADTRLRERIRGAGGTLALLHRRAIPGLRHELRIGVEGSGDGAGVQVAAQPEPLPPGCDPVTRDCPGAVLGAVLHDAQRAVGLTAQETLALQPALLGGERTLTLSLGVRADQVWHDIRDTTPDSPGEASGTARFSRWLPAGGVRFAASRRWSVGASYAEGFRPPAFLELTCAQAMSPCIGLQAGVAPDTGIGPLLPVRARNYEMDAGAASAADPARSLEGAVDVALFRLDLLDDIYSVSQGLTELYFRNVGRTRRQGVEVRARGRYRRATARLAYAFTDARFVDALVLGTPRTPGVDEPVPAGSRLPLLPRHNARVELAVAAIEGLTVAGDVSYVGAAPLRGDEANSEPMLRSYWVAGAAVRASWGRWWGALRATNLLDRRYETFGTFGPGGEPFLTPAAPVDVSAQVGCRLP